MIRARMQLALGALLTLTVTCSPVSSERIGGPQEAGSPRAPKILTMAILREPGMLTPDLNVGLISAGGVSSIYPIFHNNLTERTPTGEYEPRLATEQIAIERQTWNLNPDGTMDTTWRLRPNIRWHDGTPFTSDDMMFSFTVYKDPSIPNRIGRALGLMVSAEAPDPHTFVVHWSQAYVNADRAEGLIPLPKHLLLDLYTSDKANFANTPRFTTEFVGLGPYRLVRWEQGSHLELVRFDDYFRGRPPLDSVVVRFIGDPDTMLANAMAGAVDLVARGLVELEVAVEMKERWAGTGHQVFVYPTDSLMDVELQHRAEYARPRNAFASLPVRQALYQAIDRATLAEVMTQGLSPPADSWYPPNSSLRAQVERSIPQFPYDVARAQQLLAGAGWKRGRDGVLVHEPTGERFEVQIWATLGSGGAFLKVQNAVGDYWKSVGVQPELYTIPTALSGDREHVVTRPGAGIWAYPAERFTADTLHSRQVASAANRWTGPNRIGYSNPRAVAILDKLAITVAPAERVQLHRELLTEQMGDIPMMPLYWRPEAVLALKGVKGVEQGRSDAFNWDKE